MWISVRSGMVGTILACLFGSLLLETSVYAGSKGKTNVQLLAQQIDALEKHLETYGTISAKTADVWSEERLTQHRFEYEQQMAAQLGNFDPTLQATIRRADLAFLASATAIDAAVAGAGSRSNARSLLGTTSLTQTINLPAPDPNRFKTFSPDNPADGGVGVEPVILLDQRSRYLNHLHNLRRNNLGDDMVDLPGYSLHLMRIPVSLLPGKKTQDGYGAELTFNATPTLGDETLPILFRELVMKDLLYQFAIPLTDTLNNSNFRAIAPVYDEITKTCNRTQPEIFPISWGTEFGACGNSSWLMEEFLISLNNGIKRQQSERNLQKQLKAQNTNIGTSLIRLGIDPEKLPEAPKCTQTTSKSSMPSVIQQTGIRLDNEAALQQKKLSGSIEFTNDNSLKMNENYQPSTNNSNETQNGNKALDVAIQSEKLRSDLNAALSDVLSQSLARYSRTTTRTSQIPFPLSSFSSVYGDHMIIQVLINAYHAIPGAINYQPASYTDVERYLTDEIQAAYEFLSLPSQLPLWEFSEQGLLEAVRSCNDSELSRIRSNFYSVLPPSLQNRPIGAFAWAIIVDATLLADRMRTDFREVASQKNCPCLTTDLMDLQFPSPSPETRLAFNEYIRCRWPLRVFALDPEIQDQNVADSYSSRRELQLALAVGVASGQMTAENATRFARRLELDIDTIALNRTAVAFSQGNDTFGWRFAPRVQTPPIESNLTVAFRDLLIGGPGKDAVRRQRAMEPGPRECVVLMLCPSFIRQVSLDIRSDWYCLGNSRRTGFSLSETVDLSRQVTALKEFSQACQMEAHLYRDGEVYRLLRRVDQLSARLPLQTLHVELPTRVKSHGFKLFAQGAIFDAGPALYNWFGAPGVDADKDTTLFLLGENFSLSGLQVIAGNRELVPRKHGTSSSTPKTAGSETAPKEEPVTPSKGEFWLLSDQCMQVTIPAGAMTFLDTDGDGERKRYVEIHVANCFGVSQALRVPVISGKADAEAEAKKTAEAAASKAVAEHVDQLHLSRFEFVQPNGSPAPNTIIIGLDPTNSVRFERAFANAQPILKRIDATGPVLSRFGSSDKLGVEVAFRVRFLPPEGDNTTPVQTVLGPFNAGSDLKLNWTEIEESLQNFVLKNIKKAFKYDRIQFVGYIREVAVGDNEVRQIANPLTFKAEFIK